MIPPLVAAAPAVITKCSATISPTKSRSVNDRPAYQPEFDTKMNNELINALKNRLVLALVIAGTITIAIPIFVFGLIGAVLELSLWSAASQTLAVAERIGERLDVSHKRISKNDRPPHRVLR